MFFRLFMAGCMSLVFGLSSLAYAGALNNWAKFGADHVAMKTLEKQGVDPESKEGRLMRAIVVEGMYGDSSKMTEAAKELAPMSLGTHGTSDRRREPARSSRSSVDVLEDEARRGSVVAMRGLGNYYYLNNKGDDKNLKSSFRYYSMAADKGDLVSIGRVGQFNFYGIGTVINGEKGFAILSKAAERGDRNAQIWLAVIHSSSGRYTDYKKAMYWAEKQKTGKDAESIKIYNIIKKNVEFWGAYESRVIFKEHSFDIDFEKFGQARFEVLSNDEYGGPYYKMVRFRLHADKSDYYMQPAWDELYSYKVDAVSFFDINHDQLKDIIIVASVLYSRPGEIMTWPNNEIWLATDSGQFVSCESLNTKFSSFQTVKDIRRQAKQMGSFGCASEESLYGMFNDPYDDRTLRQKQ